MMTFLREEDGTTAIEYALIASLVSVAILAVTYNLGMAIHDTFDTVTSQMASSP